MAFTKFTSEDFRKRYNIDLNNYIDGGDDPDNAVESRIDLVIEKIEEYIVARMPGFDIDDLTEAQEKYVNRAAMQQLKYELEETDYSNVSGYNALTGSVVDPNLIDRIVICRNTKKTLNNHIISSGWY
jgi:hypothetical protein